MSASIYSDALVYDILHSPGTAGEVRGLLELGRRFVPRGVKRVLEPACGSGRYLRLLARRGIDVIGMDLEAGMAEFARVRVAQAAARGRALGARRASVKIFAGDMREFVPPVKAGSVDLAFNMINTIRHLETDGDVLRHLEQVAAALKPGGAYAVGLSVSLYGREGVSEDVWSGRRGQCEVRQVITYFPPKGPKAGREGHRDEAVHSHLTILRGRGAGVREEHKDSRYVLRSYSLEQWRELVGRSAMREEAVVDERGRDHALSPPGYGVFVLRAR